MGETGGGATGRYAPPLFSTRRAQRLPQAALRRLFHRLFVFDCTLSGPGVLLPECVGDGVLCPEAVRELRVRVPPALLPVLRNLLARCDFPLSWHPHPELVDWYVLDVAELQQEPVPPGSSPFVMTMELTSTSRFQFVQKACDFDVDLPVRSQRMMTVMEDASRLAPHAAALDPLGFVTRRARARRFALLRANYNCDDRLCARVRRAQDMVAGGWTMDCANAVQSWLVARWWVLSHPDDGERLRQGAGCEYARPRVGGAGGGAGGGTSSLPCVFRRPPEDVVCPLCHETFVPSDVVVRLSCGHVFHCACSPCAPSGGLMQWLILGNPTCPMCRLSIAC